LIISIDKDNACAPFSLSRVQNWGPKQAGTPRASSGIKYHYYDKVEPNVSQKGRDDKETPALLDFLARHRGVFRFGEPTAVGAMDM
jgi:hypothetical protein